MNLVVNGLLNGQWILDRRVPVALLVGLLIQAVGFGAWGGIMSARIANLERITAERASLAREIGELTVMARENARKLERLEEKLDDLRDRRLGNGG